jgi:hypothetical protein
MSAVVEESDVSAPEAGAVRLQLELLVRDELLRSSKRSVAFLRYIVDETLHGHAGDLKERTIGVNVFGKVLTYDTNLDHVVRTAASELRKRLALYYGREEHRRELRISLLPGSYVPQFHVPANPSVPTIESHAERGAETIETFASSDTVAESATATRRLHAITLRAVAIALVILIAVAASSWQWMKAQPTPQQVFWRPLLSSGTPVLIAVGDVPGGPPIASAETAAAPAPTQLGSGPPTVPFADAVTIARLAAVLATQGKDFVIRRESSSSFADFRERPVVLVGAFNNEWSLKLTRGLRFSLAMDAAQRMIYIRDREHPEARQWHWGIDRHPEETERASSKTLHDYALISRTLDSETGHDVIVVGGLYIYGTQAAGEFLADPQMTPLPRAALKGNSRTFQIVLETTVTDGTAGLPRIVAVQAE